MSPISFKLREVIYDMVTQGSNREDLKIVMGIRFYAKFIDEMIRVSGATMSRVTHFEGILVESTHYLRLYDCIIMDEKKILEKAESIWSKERFPICKIVEIPTKV